MNSKLIRTIYLFIPAITLIVAGVVNLAVTGLRSLIYWAFNRSNYWNLENEWHQVQMDAEEMYRYWEHGNA